MASKNALPTWKTLGLDGPPPADDFGYWNFGTVWTAEQGPQRESLRSAWDMATWSWSYWGKKVRRDIAFVRSQGGHRSLSSRALDALALTLVGIADRVHRPKG